MGRAKKPSPAPAKRLGIDLARIEGALVIEKEFPRPQWKIVRTWLEKNIAEDDLSAAWQEIAWTWLSRLREHLGGSYSVSQSTNFILLTNRDINARQFILRTSETAVQLLVHWLGVVAEKRGHGKHVILDFDTIENYYDYVSYFYATDAGVRASGGVFLRKGYQHIALPPLPRPQDTLIHELTHNRLSHLPLPSWLNEGIAVTIERKIGGNKGGRLDRDLHRKHREYWTTETIVAFWTGDSFDDDEGEVIHLSYSLAETLVDLMVQEFPSFMDFVAHAQRDDAGQAAARKVFGVDLNEIAAIFLGPGDWTSGLTKKATP